MQSAKLRPSIHGFYVRNYLFATGLSVILVLVSTYLIVTSAEFLISIGLAILAILLIVLGVVHSYVNHRSASLYTQNREQVVYEVGILSHHKRIAPVSRITDSSIKRSFIERIVGVADLHIHTAGTGDTEIDANDFDYQELEEFNNRLHQLIHRTPMNKKPKKESK